MANKATQLDYFNLDYVISLIFAIIPVTSLVCGVVTRFKEGKIVAGIIRIVFCWNLIYLLDLISMVSKRSILRVINV